MEAKQLNSNNNSQPKLGIIAGGGDLPQQVIEACRAIGRDIYVIAIKDVTEPNIINHVAHSWLYMGQIGKAIKTFKQQAVNDVIMIGRVGRPRIATLHLDISGLRLLSQLRKLPEQSDDHVFSTIIYFFEKAGFHVVGVESVLNELLIPPGPLGDVTPNDQAWNDIRTGMKVAHEIGKLDIGQAVIIQRGQVLGVEGAEGTDKLIARCKALHNEGQGGILVKMRKPNQDTRVDLPSIGVTTIENAYKSGLTGIAIEAASALIINRDSVVQKANECGIFIVGVNPLETA